MAADQRDVAKSSEAGLMLDDMSPQQIVQELDRHVVGQSKAKRAVAIALRNRIRRQKLAPELAREIQPKNIIMIGSTGVGKTEIARRLAQMSNAPFLKVEASKFTEVGYVGRDVESIIRDLADTAAEMVRQEKVADVEERAEKNAEERLLDLLTPKKAARSRQRGAVKGRASRQEKMKEAEKARDKLRQQLRSGKLNERRVELEVTDYNVPSFEILGHQGADEMDTNLREIFSGMFSRTTKRKMQVSEAIDYLVLEEEAKLIDMEQVTREALDRVERFGIIFLDELDKIAGRESGQGPDVSREGVQRDILPIIEGTTVSTRYGMLQTDHILFIAAGAFHVARPSDLIPELQGRFPIRVEMESLTEKDFIRILLEPQNALIKQYQALLETEGITLTFTTAAVEEIAHFAALVNDSSQNIGARRLHTIMEALLEEVSFLGPALPEKDFVVDDKYVRRQLSGIVKDQDLSRYIL